MERRSKILEFILTLLIFQTLDIVESTNRPAHGFFLIVNNPELGRQASDLYLYAINPLEVDPIVDTVTFEKKGGLSSNIVKTGYIVEDGSTWGCYLRAGLPQRYRGSRYGTYTATLDDGSTSMIRYGFVKPKTALLDTRGVYTVTIYPAASGSPSPLSSNSPEYIGVTWSPGCRKIRWCKGKERLKNTGPKLKLTSTDDAGMYTILRRGSLGKRGWFVQIQVIAASCQFDEYLDSVSDPPVCVPRNLLDQCMNGGVLRNEEQSCICMPYWGGVRCESLVDADGFDGGHFVLAQQSTGGTVACKDLPGGNPNCKGHLICYGDLYGCKCASGWWGNNCDRPCAKGRWGAGCTQKCPPDDSACNRFFGQDPPPPLV